MDNKPPESPSTEQETAFADKVIAFSRAVANTPDAYESWVNAWFGPQQYLDESGPSTLPNTRERRSQ